MQVLIINQPRMVVFYFIISWFLEVGSFVSYSRNSSFMRSNFLMKKYETKGSNRNIFIIQIYYLGIAQSLTKVSSQRLTRRCQGYLVGDWLSRRLRTKGPKNQQSSTNQSWLWIHRSFLILCCVLVNPKECFFLVWFSVVTINK